MRGHENRHCTGNLLKDPIRKVTWPETEKKANLISCEKCSALFDTKRARREHILAAHPFMNSCPLCQKVFKGLKGLNNHISNASCQKKNRSHMNSDGSKTFKCQKCPTVCSSRKGLKIHGRSAHLEGDGLPFKCTTCSKSFLKISYLEEHMNRFHSAVKNFPCMFCPKRCATKQDLDRHLMSHREETIFHSLYFNFGLVCLFY